ncbi:hypothetical protein DFJ67_2656 [Asanoa ferruginea]|uniref:Uncharacterized protein n=1 Tax=Asanoa ferruginea TaxID=53367 RepID=A0A3D9ZHC8_9ACTN|nr:hypothetical protein [Asanoa ferruginea]REF96665.1 hypothetical protein DFJ67_2656 [Asanoa ferruginea]GIF48952.1 hypothetical protein Afe04nite_34910 [Asanoa ferruginea]
MSAQIALVSVGSAVCGAAATVGAVGLRRWFRKRARVAAVKEFFGLPGKVLIVHSAVFDPPEQAWNYPATDTKAARALATILEASGMREGVDFSVLPDRRVDIDDELWRNNLVLLCGPARNAVLAHLTPSLSMSMRYTMTVDDEQENVLTDHERETRMLSSREAGAGTIGNYDYGLIASLPNPRQPQRRVVLLAGIHGTGTVGAAGFVTDAGNLRTLNGRRADGIVSEVVRVDYADDIETPTRTRLV